MFVYEATKEDSRKVVESRDKNFILSERQVDIVLGWNVSPIRESSNE